MQLGQNMAIGGPRKPAGQRAEVVRMMEIVRRTKSHNRGARRELNNKAIDLEENYSRALVEVFLKAPLRLVFLESDLENSACSLGQF